jgi:hypothetical protein
MSTPHGGKSRIIEKKAEFMEQGGGFAHLYQ